MDSAAEALVAGRPNTVGVGMKHETVSPKKQGRVPVARWTGWTLGFAAVVAAGAFSIAPAPADAQAPRVHSGETPDYHVIREGDTIWDLSGAYYGDSYAWPRMWSYNPHITNPHWVYPGDVVYLRDVDRGGDDSGSTRPLAQRASNDAQEQPLGLYLPLGGVLTAEEMKSVGRIIDSPKSAIMLAEHDTAWVGFGDKAYSEGERDSMHEDDMKEMEDVDVSVGDRFAIVRLDGYVEDQRGERHGNKYVVLGSLVITEVPEQEEVAQTAMIEQSWREIERGDLLVPYERQLKLVQPRQADNDVVAHIIDTLDPGFAFGPQQYVFIDRGAEDGVRVGNRFFIYQRFGGLDRPGAEAAPEIPWQRVGQVLIMDVREQHSTAVITRSSREVIVGDRLEMYSGH